MKSSHFTPVIYGFTLSGIMSLLLGIQVLSENPDDEYAIINHIIFCLFAICVPIFRIHKQYVFKRTIISILVIMLVIDAFSVNYMMPIFAPATTWYGLAIVATCLNIIAISFFRWLPKWTKCIVSLVTGLLCLIPLVAIISLLPVLLFAFIGIVFLGIGIVAYAPVVIVWHNVHFLVKHVFKSGLYMKYYFSGLTVALFYTIFYIANYSATMHKLESYNRLENPDTPGWVNVAQRADRTPMTERILKTEITYATVDETRIGWSSRLIGETAHFDPLFVLASLLSGTIDIDIDSRVSILKTMYDKHHFDEERLWDGDDLKTTSVQTKADIWPEYHLSYTEHTITVSNHSPKNRWRSMEEEAIYTFHLTPGATVSSLSLWINGKEEKGILTSKEKAQTAYKDVVGVQRRDPSVVHWRENDRVVVRVFPVPADGKRKFKIGITAPLSADHQQLTYQPGWFEGPGSENASYDLKLKFNSSPNDLVYPVNFSRTEDMGITKVGAYEGRWAIRFSDPGLGNASFLFNNQRYTLWPYQPSYESYDPASVYLDLNSTWSDNQFEQVMSACASMKIFAYYNNSFIQLTASNRKQIFSELSSLHFTFFPFHKLTDTDNSLVITTGSNVSPYLSDIEAANFSQALHSYLLSDKPRVFNLGYNIAPYISGLKSSHAIIYEQGDINMLQNRIAQHSFIASDINADKIDLPDSEMSIIKATDSIPAKGPDHLARLFAYNWVMQQNAVINADTTMLIDVATKAYVVSPVSSLIVLENQADYDKHKITNDDSGLGNAALKGHGSVPEPHEWALFIVAACILAYVRYGNLFFKRKAAC